MKITTINKNILNDITVMNNVAVMRDVNFSFTSHATDTNGFNRSNRIKHFGDVFVKDGKVIAWKAIDFAKGDMIIAFGKPSNSISWFKIGSKTMPI
ncbi:hypothetical protein JXA27_06495 [Aerococcaceae bacterium zg-B36]|uniref:hypothetical protein n=1 Tax=Aerococcaceae bacterium zg-252 TaxID=2796928 RepID=UPI001BD7FA2A|nr:hypothetical protein [Aerococcaceae bacterium zg-B36]